MVFGQQARGRSYYRRGSRALSLSVALDCVIGAQVRVMSFLLSSFMFPVGYGLLYANVVALLPINCAMPKGLTVTISTNRWAEAISCLDLRMVVVLLTACSEYLSVP